MQGEINEILGYNFEFRHPFDLIEKLKHASWTRNFSSQGETTRSILMQKLKIDEAK